jgi:hypothetical protein
VVFSKFRNEFLDRLPTRLADDVGNKEQLHRDKLSGERRRAKRFDDVNRGRIRKAIANPR